MDRIKRNHMAENFGQMRFDRSGKMRLQGEVRIVTKPFFKPLDVGGQTYHFDHLEPFSFNIESKIAQKNLSIHVTFTNHCFTTKYIPESHLQGEPIIDRGSERPRAFCRTRYRLSKQLPDLISGLSHPKSMVKQSSSRRNWAYSIQISDPTGPYHVFFVLRRAVQPGRQKQDLSMVVESAYHGDSGHPGPVLLGEMGFVMLCGKTYTGQKVATRR